MNRDLIYYRLEKARKTLKDAELLMSANRLISTVNRLYCTLFYAVLALLETKELASFKHSGVRALFNQYFVKPGVISKETGQFYGELFKNRQKGDYVDYTEFNLEEVKKDFEKCHKCLKEIEEVVLETIEKERQNKLK